MKSSPFHRPDRGDRGFTLIELLVVIGIIAILAAILIPGIVSMQNKGKLAKEINAARQLMAAYAGYAAEHDNALMPGYNKHIQDVSLPSGTALSGEMCCRYPWRLAPYLSERVEEIFLVNDNKKVTDGKKVDTFDYQYRASLNPALGINAYCVGGYDAGDNSGNFTTDLVKTLGGATHASNLIVFASARMKIPGQQEEEVAGNFLITPPHLWRTSWQPVYDANSASSNFGNVAMRWEGKAVCAFLDGHAALLNEQELRDMRHWSNTAADNNDSSYTVPR